MAFTTQATKLTPAPWGVRTRVDIPRDNAHIKNLRLSIRAPGAVWERAHLQDVEGRLVVGGNIIMSVDAAYVGSIWADTVSMPIFTPQVLFPLYLLQKQSAVCEICLPTKPASFPCYGNSVECFVEYEGDGRSNIVRDPLCIINHEMDWAAQPFMPIVLARGQQTELGFNSGGCMGVRHSFY